MNADKKSKWEIIRVNPCSSVVPFFRFFTSVFPVSSVVKFLMNAPSVRVAGIVALLLAGVGCDDAHRRAADQAAGLYYGCYYTEARQVVRDEAADRTSGDVVLNNLRLGMASMAWGDLDEAQRAMLTAYEYLTTGNINTADRTAAATILYEGNRVWTGEPYEQAMAFYELAALYLVKGDVENARAAIRNSLFKLRDFKADAPRNEGGNPEGRKEIESQFVLGYLVLGLCEELSGQDAAADAALDHAVRLNIACRPLVERIKHGDFDTFLLIDYGRGPRKHAVGEDGATVKFEPDGRRFPPPEVSVAIDGQPVAIPLSLPGVDLWVLSQYPKWWSLDTVRQAKSAIGSGLAIAGAGATVIGAGARSKEAVYAGLGAIAAGLLLKATARADDRHLAMLPHAVYLVPLTLGELPGAGGRHAVNVGFAGDPLSTMTWHDITPGSFGRPRFYYMRQHDNNGRGMPRLPDAPLYYTQYTERPAPPEGEGLRYYLDGGNDLSAPTDVNVRERYRAAGVVFLPGPQGLTGNAAMDPMLYRHLVLGGRVLWSPMPGSYGHELLTRMQHPPFAPSPEVFSTGRSGGDTMSPSKGGSQ